MSSILKVGDKVSWRGSFGTAAPQEVVVKGMELTEHPREKSGVAVEAVSWDSVRANKVIFDLENGHWAYGEQISPI